MDNDPLQALEPPEHNNVSFAEIAEEFFAKTKARAKARKQGKTPVKLTFRAASRVSFAEIAEKYFQLHNFERRNSYNLYDQSVHQRESI